MQIIANSNEKNPTIVKSMFASVAQNYDQANSVLSLGIHHLWRKKLVSLVQPKVGFKVLDCATGTGDLAIAFKKSVGSDGVVIGTDFCEEMLAIAPHKAAKKHLDIQFQLADVMSLPFQDNSFDISSISFGIRNVVNPVKGLSEMARVVKPGGKIVVLEFGQVSFPILGSLYNWYSQKILPKIGGVLTGQKKAYEYLQKTSASFPCKEEFCQLMQTTGFFSKVTYHSLSFGIAYIYIGIKK